ncbi:MAG: DUF424 family protein [Candidatus Micrarchaeia archaeon]|jgi:hypothetical protein
MAIQRKTVIKKAINSMAKPAAAKVVKAPSAKSGKAASQSAKPPKPAAKSYYLKTHTSRFSTIVAVCDKDCLGKKFESGGLILDLNVHRRFYEGELVSEERVNEALCSASCVNIVGDKSVGLACSSMGVSKAGVKKIGGVSHLQIYRV